MSLLEQLETDMRSRQPGWWQRLGEAIPELQPLSDTPQPPEFHAEGDVAVHTRLAIETCPADCDPDLLWVALLHDIGKPATTIRHDDGRITAHGHAQRGAELAEGILARLAMPDQRCRRIIWVIRHHIFHHSWQLTSPEELTSKQRAYLTSPDFPLLLEFLRVDSIASHGQTDGLQAYEFYRQIRETLTAPC